VQNREVLLEKIFELALEYDMKYRGCARAVLAALEEKLNVGSKDIFKAGSAVSVQCL